MSVVNHMSKKEVSKKRILVAPLNWGLGHATRCIPIINALINNEFEPVIASDGGALELLRKEFPQLKSHELPSYNITYPKKGKSFNLKFLKSSPHIFKVIRREKKAINSLVKSEDISGIISDNRFGVRHTEIPCVYLTHQLNVISGKTTWFTSKWHQNIIKKYDECWVPDFESEPNLSGILGHINSDFENINYIGPLSRFQPKEAEITNDILVILSGPEPQRSYLQNLLLTELSKRKESVILVRGIVEPKQTQTQVENITIFNYMTSEQLEASIHRSELIISRSGYTTIMDLAKLGKKAVFIPTPGQHEQIYLSKKLNDEKVIPSFEQEKFLYEKLSGISGYSGFNNYEYEPEFKDLFSLF